MARGRGELAAGGSGGESLLAAAGDGAVRNDRVCRGRDREAAADSIVAAAADSNTFLCY